MDEFRKRPTTWTNRPEARGYDPSYKAMQKPSNTLPNSPADVKNKVSQNVLNGRQLSDRKSRKNKRYFIIGAVIGIAVVAIVAIALLGLGTRNHKSAENTDLPASILSQVKGFIIYYPRGNFVGGFHLSASTVDYQSGVLVFGMVNKVGVTLAFTEQAIPPSFDYGNLRADKTFTTSYGSAFITDEAQRTTGALFTRDKTWILVNAPTPIGPDSMTTVLDAMQPAN